VDGGGADDGKILYVNGTSVALATPAALGITRTYDTIIRNQGAVTAGDDVHVLTFRQAVRLYNIDASTTTGSVTVDLKKNGTNIGGINAVAVTSTQTETAVDSGGNAYIDFAAGDKLSIDKSSVSSAENLEIYLDIEVL
jgi:hypothetical protein